MNKTFLIIMLFCIAFFSSCDKESSITKPEILEGQDQVLIDFYRQKPVKFRGRSVNIKDFWHYSNDALESEHNYVQWLFPIALAGLSPAPVLSEKSVELMRTDPEIKKNVLKSFDIMLKFLGYTRDPSSCKLQRNDDFDERAENWVIMNSHNHLRMTRLLLFLKYLGLNNCAENLFEEFKMLKNDDKFKNSIPDSTFKYWQDASDGIEGRQKHEHLLPKK